MSAGKSSLLNLLSGRLSSNNRSIKLSGDLYINQTPCLLTDSAKLTNMSGYVLQDDVFVPIQTVREHLEFSAKLRTLLDDNKNNENSDKDKMNNNIQKKVDDILGELGLNHVSNSIVGSVASGSNPDELSVSHSNSNNILIQFIIRIFHYFNI